MLHRLKAPLRRVVRKHFKLPYQLSRTVHGARSAMGLEPAPRHDLVFVVSENNRGWIIEAICKEIAAYFPGTVHFHYSVKGLPPAKAYFFSHYSLLMPALRYNPMIWSRTLLVFHTHPRELATSEEELVYAFNQASRIICMCSMFRDMLVSQGVAREKTAVVVGAADPETFLPHARGTGAVGFCTAYYERKSPDTILEIVKRLPHRRFVLLGRGWEAYPRFEELTAQPNFSYVVAPYAEYPQHYAGIDVFVSPAKLEGGPIPLLEAMMSNAVPVASRTGFAPDVIRHGENGFLFEVDAPAETICDMIEQAYEVRTDVRNTVAHLSWRHFSEAVQAFLGPTGRSDKIDDEE